MTKLKSYVVRSITACKGSPRVYLDINSMSLAGFEPGKTYIRDAGKDPESPRITLVVQQNGTHVVSRKEKGDKVLPIIDVNNSDLLKPFAGMKAVRIVVQPNRITILPLASETKRLKRLKSLRENLESGELITGGISFGGGVLDHAAHAGLADAGIAAKLMMANEIDEGLLAHAADHNDIWNPLTVSLAAPMQELAQDDWALAQLPKLNIMAMGLPCSGASQAGKSKRKLDIMESHPEVGGLIAPAIMIVNQCQPAALMGCDTYIVNSDLRKLSTCQSQLHRYTNYVSRHSLRRICHTGFSGLNRKSSFRLDISKTVAAIVPDTFRNQK